MALISKSKSYILSAWRNNQIRLKATQGEGGIKSAQFVLTDDNGKIDLSTASSVLYNATKHDGSACSINCEIIDAVNGIISFTIESGITDMSGEVRGSIEVIADNGNVKFDGITVFVEKDTVGKLIEASDAFSALVDALNKVAQLTPEGTIRLDDILTEESVNAVQGRAIKQYIDTELKEFETQELTTTTNVTSGVAARIKLQDKQWSKDNILRITVLADESIVSGAMTIGTCRDGNAIPVEITSANINETVTYITVGESEIVGAYIPEQSVVGEGKVTLLVECLGLKSEVAKLYSDVLGIVETLDNKANASEFQSQMSTVTKNATSGSKVDFVVNDKKWLKDTVIKITVSADESLIIGKMTFGVKYEDDTSSTKIATPLVNEEITYQLTADTSQIGVYIPKESVKGNGEVTLTIVSVGLKTEVVELKEKVSNIETDIDNLRNETPVTQSPIEGKTFSILGDSASAYAGWVPEGQKSYYGNPDENETNVSSVSQMWWYILSSQLKMSLLVNDSWMGTTVSTTGYKNKDTNIPADMTASAFTTRAKSTFCENNTTSIKPDYIFIFGGINDKLAGSPVGDTMYRDWASGYTDDWTEENEKEALKSVLPSFCKLIHDIKLYNPHATIINITFDKLIGSGIDVGYAKACEDYGITNIVLSSIDITVDAGHPSWEGQLSIAEQIINKLREEDASIKTYIDVSEVGM